LSSSKSSSREASTPLHAATSGAGVRHVNLIELKLKLAQVWVAFWAPRRRRLLCLILHRFTSSSAPRAAANRTGSRPHVALRRYPTERRVDGRMGKEEDDGWIWGQNSLFTPQLSWK
jgi:hypothetical protein